MPIHTFDSEDALGPAASTAISEAVAGVLAAKESAVLALPGGSAARIVLPKLLAHDLPWDSIVVTLTDERWVSPANPASNEQLVRTLMARVAYNFVGLFDANRTPEQAAIDLEQHVPIADIILLGMGEDGHIASLFPNDAANHASSRFAAVQRPDHARVTLTPTAIAAASQVFVVFAGELKHRVFKRAQDQGSPDDYPIRHVLNRATVFAV